ncbi:MAG: iron-containing redox enzyme family protein [Thermoleophilaceae bacterium]|nr:iron-containing redox enzyme family protein [Thermoleophilaceae bacterium]
MNLFDRIDQARKRYNVLEHPFYVRWSEGELSREDLALYASQYRHAVVALADASEGSDHAAEERAHVELWERFASECGSGATEPFEETAECIASWTHAGDRLERLVTLYSIESTQPAISKTKLEGLLTHYGFEPGAGTEYFEVHSERDHEHAAESRALLEAEAGDADSERLAARAEAALAANWRLLDGVEERLPA